MQDLRVTLVQTELAWEDCPANLTMFDRKIDAIEEKTDLIVLPEMFTTGFSMNAASLAQNMDGVAVEWLLRKAANRNVDMVASLIIGQGDRYFNRLVWAKPNGQLFHYDKRHLFRMAGEEKVYSPGTENITVELKGWKIRPFVCYDLRFPVWTRNVGKAYDVSIFIANWPEKRVAHWKTLLEARAIENQAYVVGVNCVGRDGREISYSGDSSVISPGGDTLFRKSHGECVHTILLSWESLNNYRDTFPAWMDADGNLDP
jgi:omega-amidase